MRVSLPLRTSVPLLVFAITLAATAVSMWHDRAVSDRSLEHVFVPRAVALSHVAVPYLEHAMRGGGGASVTEQLQMLARQPYVLLALVCDASGRIAEASDPALRGREAGALRPLAAALVEQARRTRGMQSRISSDRLTVQVACPVTAAPSGVAVLYTETDLGARKQHESRYILLRGSVVAAVALLGCVLIWALMRANFLRDLARVEAAADAYLSGDRAARIPDLGSHESAEIGRVMNRMLDESAAQAQAARDGEARFRALFDAANDAVFLARLDADGMPSRIEAANRAAEECLGYTHDEFAAMPVSDILAPRSAEAGRRAAARLRAEGSVVFEAAHLARDGREVPVEVSARLADLGNGPYVLAIGRDLTERKRIEHELRASEETLRLTMAATDDGLWDWDIRGDRVVRNPRFYTMLGYEVGAIPETFEAFDALVHADDRPRMAEAVEQHFAGRSDGYEVELRLRAADGSWRWVLSRGKVVSRAADGSPLRMLGTHVDITDRRRAEEAARASAREHQAILQTAISGFWRVGSDGKLLEVNGAYCRMSGYSEAELLGMHTSDLDSSETAEVTAERMRAVMDRGHARFEARHRRKDGAGVDVEASAQRHPLLEGQMFAFFRDITAEKRAARETEATVRLLEILNARTSLREMMQGLLGFMRDLSGCDAVGIRLRDGDDYPYYETSGFDAEFVRKETHLCARGSAGEMLRDAAGNPVLECMCGNILCGRFNPALPFFTKGGSFVSNGTTRLLASTTEDDRQARTRNRCNGEGYESVMLVPLRAGGETFGLLQLNDRSEGRFSVEFVALVERLAGDVAIALAQRQAEEALRQERDVLQGVMDGAGDIHLAYLDRDGNFVRVNQTYAASCGYAPEEMVGKNYFALSAATGNESVFACVRDTGESYQAFDRPLAYPDHPERGTTYWDWALTPVKEPSGEVQGMVLSLHETTARRQADEQRHAALAKYRVLFELLPVAVTVADGAGQIVEANARADALLGLERSEGVGRTITAPEWQVVRMDGSAMPPEEFASARALREQRLVGPVDVGMVRLDGGTSWISVTAAPVEHYGIVVAFSDISDLRRAEAERQEFDRQRQLALSAANLGWWHYDPATRDTWWDERCREVFGLPVSRGDVDVIASRIVAEDRERMWACVRAALDPLEPRPYCIEYRICLADGSTRWVQAHGMAEFEGDGAGRRAVSLVGTVADITERKRAEAGMREALADKEALLKEVHHRVKNNLQMISGLLTLQSEDLADPLFVDALAESQGRIKSMAMVHEKLYQAGDLAHLDCQAYVRDLAADLFRVHLAPGRAIRFDLSVPPITLDLSMAIPCALLLNELLTNALKHAFQDCPGDPGNLLSVRWEDDADCWALTVADNGRGMPDKIGGEQAATLGLRLVHMLARQLRGAARLEPGPGCRWVVRFPKRTSNVGRPYFSPDGPAPHM